MCEVVEMREVVRERAQLVVREVQSWGGGGGTMLRAGKVSMTTLSWPTSDIFDSSVREW